MRAAPLLLTLVLWAGISGAEERAQASAGPVEDALRLAKAGVGEEVLTAWAETLDPYARLDTAAILALKDGQVPDKVIALLIRRGGPRPVAVEAQPVQAAGEARVVARYEVPAAAPAPRAREYIAEADYESARTRQREEVTYTYVRPASTVYVDSGYSYPEYSYPAYYSPSYVSFGLSYGYPRYSYSSCYRPYYGNYGSCHRSFSYYSHGGYIGRGSCSTRVGCRR